MKKTKKLVMCDPCSSSCPVAERTSKVITLMDDFGGKVKLSTAQLKILLSKGKTLLE